MCNQNKLAPSTASEAKVSVAAQNSTVSVEMFYGLKEAHEAHFNSIKVGVFGIVALMGIVLLFFLIHMLYKKWKNFDNRRVHRRAMSIYRKRHGEKDNPSPEVETNM